MSACGVLAGEITEITFSLRNKLQSNKKSKRKKERGGGDRKQNKKKIIHLPSIQVLMSLIKAEI